MPDHTALPDSHSGSARSRPWTLDVTTMEHPYDEDTDRANPRPVPGHEAFKHQISNLKEEVSQLNQALDSHAVIDQAIGVVSALGGIEPERGLQVLTEVSQHTNIKLRQVAEHTVAWAHSQEMPDVIRQALDAALTRNHHLLTPGCPAAARRRSQRHRGELAAPAPEGTSRMPLHRAGPHGRHIRHGPRPADERRGKASPGSGTAPGTRRIRPHAWVATNLSVLRPAHVAHLLPAHAEGIQVSAALRAQLGRPAAGVVEERAQLDLLPVHEFDVLSSGPKAAFTGVERSGGSQVHGSPVVL
jgi:hypothetical protein